MPTIFRRLVLSFLFISSTLSADQGEPWDDISLPSLDLGVDFAISDWEQFGRVGDHMGKSLRFDGELPLSRVWSEKVSFSKRGENYANMVIGDGLLYVLDAKAVVTAFDMYDGTVAWSEALRGINYPNVGGGLALGDLLYAVDGDGVVYAIEPSTGEIFWWQSLESPVSVPPLWKEGKLYIVTQNSTVYSIDGIDGSVNWSYSGVPQNRVLMNHSGPALGSRRSVIVPFPSGEVKALSTFDGKEIWSRSILLNKGGNLNLLPSVSAPVVDDDANRVFYTSQAYEIGALNVKNGNVLWTLEDVSSVHMPVLVENNLLIVTRDERLLVVNASTGSVFWNLELPFQSVDSGTGFILFRKSKKIVVWHSPIVAGGKIWLVSYKGHLVVYDGANGEIVSVQNLISNSQERITSPPVWIEGTLYVVSDNGKVSAWR